MEKNKSIPKRILFVGVPTMYWALLNFAILHFPLYSL